MELIEALAIVLVVAAFAVLALAFFVFRLDDRLRQELTAAISDTLKQGTLSAASPPPADEAAPPPAWKRIDDLGRVVQRLSRAPQAAAVLFVSLLLFAGAGALAIVDELHDDQRSTMASASVWRGTLHELEVGDEIRAYRVYGGGSRKRGAWLTASEPLNQDSARSLLALPPENAARCVVEVSIGTGTEIRIGEVATQFAEPGGGSQIEVIDGSENVRYLRSWPLAPSRGPCR